MSINIFKAQDMLKNMSKQQLVAEARNPTGSAPAFMVHARLAEVGEQEKEAQRAASKQDVTTVAQDVVQGAGTGGIGAMAQAMNPRSQDATSNGAFDPRTVPDTRTAPKAPISMQEGGEVGGFDPSRIKLREAITEQYFGSAPVQRPQLGLSSTDSAALMSVYNEIAARLTGDDQQRAMGVMQSANAGGVPVADAISQLRGIAESADVASSPSIFSNSPQLTSPSPQTLDVRTPSADGGILRALPPSMPESYNSPASPAGGIQTGKASPARGTMIDGTMYLLQPDNTVLNARTGEPAPADVSRAVYAKLNPPANRGPELGSGVNPSYQEGPTAGPTTFQNVPGLSAPDPQAMDARVNAPRMNAPRTAPAMPSPIRDSNIAASSSNQSPRPPSVDERTSSDPRGGNDAQRALDSLRADVDGIAGLQRPGPRTAAPMPGQDRPVRIRNQTGPARSPDDSQYAVPERTSRTAAPMPGQDRPVRIRNQTGPARSPDDSQYAVPELSPRSRAVYPQVDQTLVSTPHPRDAAMNDASNTTLLPTPGTPHPRDRLKAPYADVNQTSLPSRVSPRDAAMTSVRDLNTADQSADQTLPVDPAIPVDPALTAPQTTTRPARTGGIGGISAPAPITASEALAEAETATGSGDEGMTQSKWFALAQIGAGMLASTKPGFAGTGDAINAGLASYTASERDREDRELAASDRAEDQRRYEQNRADSFKLASMRGSGGRGGAERRMPMGGFGVIDDAIERETTVNASLARPEDNRVFFPRLRGALPDQNAIARRASDERLANLNALRDYQISQMTGVPQGIGSIFPGTTTIDPR